MPGGSIAALINLVDEVHTITSLAGFEALLRGRKVATYGQPFYAGWGLTTDNVPLNRRQRRLQIEELVAGTLILYPNYIDPVSRLLCGPEMLICPIGATRAMAANYADAVAPSGGVVAKKLGEQTAVLGAVRCMTSSHSTGRQAAARCCCCRAWLAHSSTASAWHCGVKNVDVRKINFNGGDKLFWGLSRGGIDYTGTEADWPKFLMKTICEGGITDVMLFGDCRPMHRAAVLVCRELNVPVHVFDEGYIRPDWVTFEHGGSERLFAVAARPGILSSAC